MSSQSLGSQPTDIAESIQRQTEQMAAGLDLVRKSIDLLEAERKALRIVLRQIVHEFNNTYDASCDGGRWTAAASIPVEVMQRAKRLVGSPA